MDIAKFGSLYLDGKAAEPMSGCEGITDISLGDTVFGDELSWVQDGDRLIADRCVCSIVSWDHLNEIGYICGRPAKIDGKPYRCRCLTGGAQMGDPNASLPTPQPVYMRPMYGAFGKALKTTCVNLMSRASIDAGVPEKLGLERICYPVHGTRQISKYDMIRNTAMPRIEINPETFYVYVDGELAYVPPAPSLALSQLYWFS